MKQIERHLDPKADLTFKKVFGKNPDLLISFLNAMLPIDNDEVVEVEYLPTELVPENPLKKNSIVDEHTTAPDPTYLTAYKFNGKEMDAETGLYYYGARYYEPELAMWYGVDALAEKYASMGGYVYCAGNPVKLVDVDGRDWYEADGELKYVEKYYKNKADFDKNSGLKGKYLGHTVVKDGMYYGLLGKVRDGNKEKTLCISTKDKAYLFCKAIDECLEKYMLESEDLNADFADAFKNIGNKNSIDLKYFSIGKIYAKYGKDTKLSFEGWGPYKGMSFIPTEEELHRRGYDKAEFSSFEGSRLSYNADAPKGYIRSFSGQDTNSSDVKFLIYGANKCKFAHGLQKNFDSMFNSIKKK